jgi:hypothetical protein
MNQVQKRGAQLTAMRRAKANKIKKQIRESGPQPLPEEPTLIDASDLPLLSNDNGNSKYRPEYASFAKEMCRLGATDIEVARGLGISLSCLWRWQAKYDDFFRAFLEGKEHCDDRVERALYHRAVGYSYPAVKIMNYQGQPVVVPYIEHVPPDVGAASKWLKSRRKEQWGEQQEINITGDESFKQIWLAISTGQILPMIEGEVVKEEDYVEAEIIEEDEDA